MWNHVARQVHIWIKTYISVNSFTDSKFQNEDVKWLVIYTHHHSSLFKGTSFLQQWFKLFTQKHNILWIHTLNLSNLHHSVKIHITWFTLMTNLDWKELPWQTPRSRGPQTFLGPAWSWSFSHYTAGPVCLSLLEKAWFLEYTLQTNRKAPLSYHGTY